MTNQKTKHTQGPWHCMSGQVERSDGAVIARMDRSQNATNAGIFPVERDANARLIAAAPEMLNALQQVFDYSDISDDFRQEIGLILNKVRGER